MMICLLVVSWLTGIALVVYFAVTGGGFGNSDLISLTKTIACILALETFLFYYFYYRCPYCKTVGSLKRVSIHSGGDGYWPSFYCKSCKRDLAI